MSLEVELFRDIEGTCKPRYDGFSIVNIPNSILKHFGLPVRGRTLHREIESRILTEKVLLVVIDGLSLNILRALVEEDSYLSFLKNCICEITSTFPSTTPTALASLATGLEPGQHGIIGCVMYFREIGLLVNTLNLSPQLRASPDEQGPRDVLLRMGVDVTQLFNIDTTIFEELSSSGVRTLVLINRGLKNGFSRLIYRGAEIQEYASFSEALVYAVNFLNDIDRGFVYVYNAVLDEVAHKRGVSSYEYYETLRDLLYTVFRIVRSYAVAPITVLVTTDHGLIDNTERDLVDMMMFRQLLNVLETPPYGDSRASHVRVLPEYLDRFREIEDVKILENWGFYVLTRDELISEKLLGLNEIPPKVRHRIGDYIFVSVSSAYLRYSYNLQEREREPLKASHGSLVEYEMKIPLIIYNT